MRSHELRLVALFLTTAWFGTPANAQMSVQPPAYYNPPQYQQPMLQEPAGYYQQQYPMQPYMQQSYVQQPCMPCCRSTGFSLGGLFSGMSRSSPCHSTGYMTQPPYIIPYQQYQSYPQYQPYPQYQAYPQYTAYPPATVYPQPKVQVRYKVRKRVRRVTH